MSQRYADLADIFLDISRVLPILARMHVGYWAALTTSTVICFCRFILYPNKNIITL